MHNCAWRGGRGDLVREVADACRMGGLEFGVYLSPADLHEPSFGREPDAYNEFFRKQLRELLSNYGKVCEVWFDGAEPGDRRQRYDWTSYHRLIRELQPDEAIVIKGPDVRWVGTETGEARFSEWSVIPLPVAPEAFSWPDMLGRDLGSRDKLRGAKYLHWYPAMADVSLRQGWFYRPGTDYGLKTIQALIEIYFKTVGRNAGLALNLSPDKRGLIQDADVNRLAEFGSYLKKTFATNLAAEARVTLEHGESKPLPNTFLFDANLDTFWESPAGVETRLVFRLPQPATFSVIRLYEAIQNGQRVEQFAVDAWMDGKWNEIGAATTIGYCRILRVPRVATERVRLRLIESRGVVRLSEFGLYSER